MEKLKFFVEDESAFCGKNKNDNQKFENPREAQRRGVFRASEIVSPLGFQNFPFSIFHFPFQERKTGFTLLETVVALAVIVSAIAGPFTLASRGVFSAKIARNKLIALNLAQEGIELIRHMRENNILNGFDWRGAGCAASATPGCVNLANGSYQQDVFTSADGSTPPLNSNARLRIMDEVTDAYYGVYSQSRGTETPFIRMVTISTPGDDKMKVVSIVTWPESGIPRRVELQEVMYNWR